MTYIEIARIAVVEDHLVGNKTRDFQARGQIHPLLSSRS